MISAIATEDLLTGDRTVIVTVPKSSLVNINLDPLDRAVINSPEESVADMLQSLQILAFREQQQSKEQTNNY